MKRKIGLFTFVRVSKCISQFFSVRVNIAHMLGQDSGKSRVWDALVTTGIQPMSVKTANIS